MSRKRWIVVDDLMQRAYRYELTAPEGCHFAPGFLPELSPKEMLELGIFGGVYMRDCREELPDSWFAKAKLADGRRDAALNYFGVLASSSLRMWKAKGWIHPDDPRGWFQWYCRYYRGRRVAGEDDRQVGRWKAFRRHAAQIHRHCEPGDPFCRPRQRQALLQWAYDSRAM